MVVVVVVGRSWLWLAAGLVEGASGSLTPSDPGLVWPLCYPSLTHTRLSPQRESVSQPASQAQPVSQSVSQSFTRSGSRSRPAGQSLVLVRVRVRVLGGAVGRSCPLLPLSTYLDYTYLVTTTSDATTHLAGDSSQQLSRQAGRQALIS